jgi:hypothetical protein
MSDVAKDVALSLQRREDLAVRILRDSGVGPGEVAASIRREDSERAAPRLFRFRFRARPESPSYLYISPK